MKRLVAALAISVLSITPALGEEKHDHSAPAETKHGMHEHMKKMRQQMAQIRDTADPGERARLMGEHMKAMEEAMASMQRMGCGKM